MCVCVADSEDRMLSAISCVAVQLLTMHGILAVAGESDNAPEGVLLIEVHEEHCHKTTHPLTVPQFLP